MKLVETKEQVFIQYKVTFIHNKSGKTITTYRSKKWIKEQQKKDTYKVLEVDFSDYKKFTSCMALVF